MTTVPYQSQFSIVLGEVGNILTTKHVQDLASLCEEISPDRRHLITTPRELYGSLQGHDLLAEDNVDYLVDLLDKLQIPKASDLLRSYRTSVTIESNSISYWCSDHIDQNAMRYCVSCNKTLCRNCDESVHNSLEILDLVDVSHEVSIRREVFINETNSLSEKIKTTENLLEQKEKVLKQRQQDLRSEICSDALSLIEVVDKNKLSLMEVLQEKDRLGTELMMKENEILQLIDHRVEQLKLRLPGNNQVEELKLVRHVTQMISNTKDQLSQHTAILNEVTNDLSYLELQNDGGFAFTTKKEDGVE